MFKAGDILVSMRQLNIVFVFDPRTEKIKWRQVGPWLRQHDPDFLKDGTISVFDNRNDNTKHGSILGGSRIVRINPATRATWTAYAPHDGKGSRHFYSAIMGKHQTLANGNILITDPPAGRVFEVTPAGEIVWQYVNGLDKDHVALMTGAIRLPENYFDFSHMQCKSAGSVS